MPDEPELPLGPSPNRPAVAAFVENAEFISSGVAVMKAGHVFSLRVANLLYQMTYADDYETHSVETMRVSDRQINIELRGFKNVLGTSLSPIRIGSIGDRPLHLALFVEAIGTDVKVLLHRLLGRQLWLTRSSFPGMPI
jgi:hypothetical protein